MKRLISALTVKQAKADGKQELIAPPQSTIITAEAKDLANKLGIRLVEASAGTPNQEKAFDEATIQSIIKQVMDRLPPEKRDLQEVTKAVMTVLANYRK